MPRVPWCVVQLPPSSRSGDSWIAGEFGAAIKSQQSFELQLMLAAPQQGGSAGSLPQGRLLRAQFRCAANTGLDSNTLPIGIPNFLPSEEAGARSFYFATLRDAAPACSSEHSSRTEPALGSSSSSTAATSARPPRREGSASRGVQFSLLCTSNQDPMPDIKLGPLLGKGAFGRVYRATWQGQLVAVKIIEYMQEAGQKGPLEGLLSEQVHHPNVVSGYELQQQRAQARPVQAGDRLLATAHLSHGRWEPGQLPTLVVLALN